MKRVTLRFESDVLQKARAHAEAKGVTFSQLVSELVAEELASATGSRTAAMFELADRLNVRSSDGPLTRDEAHDRSAGRES